MADLHDSLHNVSDRREAVLIPMFGRAVEKMQAQVSIEQLAALISIRDVRGAMRYMNTIEIEEHLQPMARVIEDTLYSGGREGAREVNDFIELENA